MEGQKSLAYTLCPSTRSPEHLHMSHYTCTHTHTHMHIYTQVFCRQSKRFHLEGGERLSGVSKDHIPSPNLYHCLFSHSYYIPGLTKELQLQL